MQKTPTEQEIEDAVRAAGKAAGHAAAVRARHRGHRRLSRREDLTAAHTACREAAAALRRLVGMVFAHNIPEDLELKMKRMNKVLEKEARKLRKML